MQEGILSVLFTAFPPSFRKALSTEYMLNKNLLHEQVGPATTIRDYKNITKQQHNSVLKLTNRNF